MSLSRETMLDLMAFADGEIDAEARERVDKLVRDDAEAARVVTAIRSAELRPWLVQAFEQRAHRADGIADAVMARLDGGGAPSAIRADSGDVQLPQRARSRSTPRAAVAGFGGVALAIAAGVALYLRVGDERAVPQQPSAAGATSSQPVIARQEGPGSPAPSTHESAPSGSGVEVDEIDSSMRVSIFELAAMADTSTPSSVVVWIDDEPGLK